MYSSTSARSAVISIRLAPSRTMASRSKLRSDRSSSPTTMLNMGVPSMDGFSAALGLQQTGGYATLLCPNLVHNFGLYPGLHLLLQIRLGRLPPVLEPAPALDAHRHDAGA